MTEEKDYSESYYQRTHRLLEYIDTLFFTFIESKAFLLGILSGIFLLILGIWYQDLLLFLQVILSGFIGYEFSFLFGLMFNVIMFLLRNHLTQIQAPLPFLQFFLCLYIVWIGYRHRKIAKLLKNQIHIAQTNHTISWTMINDVRNSLMAMRMLLFRQTKASVNELDYKMVEEELLRLEGLFGTLIKNDEDKNNSVS